MNTEEVWKCVIGFEKSYSVSNLGRVKSNYRIITRKNGSPLVVKDRVLKIRMNPYGYVVCALRNKEGCYTKMVHRLVAESFIPNPDNKRTVNHIDGNKTNNYYKNLEWATDSEQHLHAFSTGLKKCHKVKVLKDGKEIPNCNNLKELAKLLKVDKSFVYNRVIRKKVNTINGFKIELL